VAGCDASTETPPSAGSEEVRPGQDHESISHPPATRDPDRAWPRAARSAARL